MALKKWEFNQLIPVIVVAFAFEHVSDVVPVSLLPLPLFLCILWSLGVLDLVYGLVVFGGSLCGEIGLDLDCSKAIFITSHSSYLLFVYSGLSVSDNNYLSQAPLHLASAANIKGCNLGVWQPLPKLYCGKKFLSIRTSSFIWITIESSLSYLWPRAARWLKW